jgi:hypothetical protein
VTRYSGRAKILVCRKLIHDWRDIADFCEVPPFEQTRFLRGREPQDLWEHLDQAGRMADFEEALKVLNRHDLLRLLDELERGARGPDTGDQHPVRRPATVDTLSTATFDLRKIREAIDQRLAGATTGLIAFSVPYGDSVFLAHLCEFLATFADDTECKQPFSLSADISSTADVVQSVVAYRDEELASVDVIVPIQAEGADAETIGGFLTELSAAMGTLGRRLLVVLTVSEGIGVIRGACTLERPEVTRQDVRMWLREQRDRLRGPADRRIPAATTDRWASRIADRADGGSRGLILRVVYDEFHRTFRRLRDDPDEFLHSLAKGK